MNYIVPNIANDIIIFERRFSPFQTTQNNFAIVIHCLNDGYSTAVIVPGSLLRSTKECKLGYFMRVPGSRLNFTVIRNSSGKVLLVV